MARVHDISMGGGGVSFPETNKTVYSTPGEFSFVVPAGVTKLGVKAWGGGGGSGGSRTNSGYNSGKGGNGSFVQAVMDVTPGETLTLVVADGGMGGQGENSGTSFYATGGFGNGGNGGRGSVGTGGAYQRGAAGGGYTGVHRSASIELCAAGGGGGASSTGGSLYNAIKGGLSEAEVTGYYSYSTGGNSYISTAGFNATQEAGGLGGLGTYNGDSSGTPGTIGGAGQGADVNSTSQGANSGGGGGGKYGGGAGAHENPLGGTGGGAGSSYWGDAFCFAFKPGDVNGADEDYVAGVGAGGASIGNSGAQGNDGGDGLLVITY